MTVFNRRRFYVGKFLQQDGPSSEGVIVFPFYPMRREGFSFNLGGLGVEALGVAFCFAALRCRPFGVAMALPVASFPTACFEAAVSDIVFCSRAFWKFDVY